MKAKLFQLTIWLGLIILLNACNSCSTSGSVFFSTPSEVIRKYLAHIEKGEVELAARQMSKGWLGGQSIDEAKDKFVENVGLMKSCGGIQSIEITKEEILGETATVENTISYKNGRVEKAVYKLVKEGGHWKIASGNSYIDRYGL